MLIHVVVVLGVLCGAHSFSSGAPRSACRNMKPNHNAAPSEEPPYFLTVEVHDGNFFVTLSGNDPEQTFKGFMIQALERNGEEEQPIGEFNDFNNESKLLSCSAVTHKNKSEKSFRTFQWVPPVEHDDMTVFFRATVVKSKNTYWEGLESEEFNLQAS